MRPLLPLSSVLLACLSAAAIGCANSASDAALDLGSGPGAPDAAASAPDLSLPLGAPITAPPNVWTWIDFPDAVCDDGTPTGLGINLAAGSQDLLIFLNGGGACWDYDSCAVSNLSTHGPYGSAQFQMGKAAFSLGSILDRNLSTPFHGYNLVFIPYCTGDVHVGDNVVTYENGMGGKKVIHHQGRPNLVAFLKRLAATVRSPGHLVISGSSAGGFGAALNYDLFRTYFPHAHSYLIDDSGPPMIGDAIPKNLRDTWYSAWRLDKTLAPLCPLCQQDFGTLVTILARKYPGDRMALLSNNQDGVIRSFFGNQTAQQFQDNLYAMAMTLLDPQPNFRYYFAAGTGHTFLYTPSLSFVKGVWLPTWLTQMGTDDPKWVSLRP